MKTILGSAHRKLAYFDCFAGPGVYEFEGERVDGSPLIALKAGRTYINRNKGKELTLAFIEKDERTRLQLTRELEANYPLPVGLHVSVLAEDASDFVSSLLSRVSNLVPSFFLVDPYGHPLTIPILNQVLQRPRTEALINIMYFRISMNLDNPRAQARVDTMFGGQEWRSQPFMGLSGREREDSFLEYFCQKINAKYKFIFRILMDVEDNVPGRRTKYYLLHASNNAKAVLLMKEIMWKQGDQEGTFEYGGSRQTTLFSQTPTDDQLRSSLLKEFTGQQIAFDDLREKRGSGDSLKRITALSFANWKKMVL